MHEQSGWTAQSVVEELRHQHRSADHAAGAQILEGGIGFGVRAGGDRDAIRLGSADERHQVFQLLQAADIRALDRDRPDRNERANAITQSRSLAGGDDIHDRERGLSNLS